MKIPKAASPAPRASVSTKPTPSPSANASAAERKPSQFAGLLEALGLDGLGETRDDDAAIAPDGADRSEAEPGAATGHAAGGDPRAGDQPLPSGALEAIEASVAAAGARDSAVRADGSLAPRSETVAARGPTAGAHATAPSEPAGARPAGEATAGHAGAAPTTTDAEEPGVSPAGGIEIARSAASAPATIAAAHAESGAAPGRGSRASGIGAAAGAATRGPRLAAGMRGDVDARFARADAREASTASAVHPHVAEASRSVDDARSADARAATVNGHAAPSAGTAAPLPAPGDRAGAPLAAAGFDVQGAAATTSAGAADAPGGTYALPTPLRDPGFADALGQRVGWMIGEELQTAEIVLQPAELGPIRIELQIAGDATTISFIAEHAETREVLESSLPRLREMLAEDGLQLVGAQVGRGSRDGSRHDESARAQRAPTAGAKPATAGRYVDPFAPTGPQRTLRGMIDVFA